MKNRLLSQITAFKECDGAFHETLASHAQERTYAKNEVLFIHGDVAERFYFIKTGWIKLFRETLDGAQAVIDILPAGHIFGETSIFEDGCYAYSAEAIEPCDIVSFALPDLKNEIEKNNKLALNILQTMTRTNRQKNDEIEHRSVQNASQRVGCFLLRLADQRKTGPVTIHLPYDKTLVAARLGMQPETFSRALSKLREKTGIQINGATVQFDSIKQLSDYTCIACSSEFPCRDLNAAE